MPAGARYIGTMVTSLEASVARGRASIHLEVSRSPASRSSRRLGLAAMALVVPAAVILGYAALASAIGLRDLDLGPARPWLFTGISVLCVAGCALVAVARLRFSAGRGDGGWHGRVSVQLAPGSSSPRSSVSLFSLSSRRTSWPMATPASTASAAPVEAGARGQASRRSSPWAHDHGGTRVDPLSGAQLSLIEFVSW